MLAGNYKSLFEQLTSVIDSKRIFHDPLHTLAYGTDASFYRLIPKIVIKAKDEEEVSLILQKSSALSLPVTFRAAGTSLSGQAISDSVLVIAGHHWKKFEISEDGKIKSKGKNKKGTTLKNKKHIQRRINKKISFIDTGLIILFIG